jgi:PAS domain S-box-containing protein
MIRATAALPGETNVSQAVEAAELPSLARVQRRVDIPARWALLALGIWVVWHTRDAGWLGPWPWIMAGYTLIAVVTTGFWIGASDSRIGTRLAPWVAYGSLIVDALFASALIWRDGGLGSPLYVLLFLLPLKSIYLAPALPGAIWVPFAFGPFYVLSLGLAVGNFGFLVDPAFWGRYLLLWIWLIGIVLLARGWGRRTAQVATLSTALVEQQAALAQKTEVLQRTATDLGDRVLELRSLQEVAKALASTLRLKETLQLIAERLRSVTGSSHCAVALVETEVGTIFGESSYLDITVAGDENSELPVGVGRPRPYVQPAAPGSEDLVEDTAHTLRLALLAEPPTLEALRSERVLRVRGQGASDSPLRQLLGDNDYLIMPLLSRGRPIGALYLAEKQNTTPDGKVDQLVSSFAYFASTAIENARLFQEAGEKRRELEAVLAGIGDGVVVVDPDLHLLLMNPVARGILGLEAEPPAGVPLGPYLSDPAFGDLLAETLHSQHEVIRELDLPAARSPDADTSREGSARTYGILVSPVLNADGKVNGVVAVLRDITAQKEIERMKSNFLSVVSHELRTPLHSIKGFVEIILMGKTGPVTELQEDFLRTVRSQTTVLQRMIDDLLEFSRMEAGRARLHLSEVSLPAVAHGVVTRLIPLAEEGGLGLFLDLPADLPEVDGDRARLDQVLTNLVENAIKFTPPGGKIRVSGQALGDRVHLVVADTGIGIPPEEQEKVFDRFYQVDGGERRAYRGTGLGLSICKHIVERHGGRIWVESDGTPGHGSCFHVELPIELRPVEVPTIDFTTPVGQSMER